ncbi:hypothetical protein VTH06DRAFT_7386 [Thermothelomyces fergusii]
MGEDRPEKINDIRTRTFRLEFLTTNCPATRVKPLINVPETMTDLMNSVPGLKTIPNWPLTLTKTVYNNSLWVAKKVTGNVAKTGHKVKDDGMVTAAINSSVGALSSRLADGFLQAATAVFTAAGDTAVVDSLLELIGHTLEALTQSLSAAALIVRGIFTNDTNETTLDFIVNHLNDFFRFLLDLIQPENVIPRFETADGAIGEGCNGSC